MKLNARGATLIEALVGVSLIAGLAYLTTSFIANNKIAHKAGGTCHSLLASVFSSLESEGAYGNVQNFIPNGAARTPGAGGSSNWVTDSNLFVTAGAAGHVVATGTNPQVRNHSLISGSLRTLTVLYNTGLYDDFTANAALQLSSNTNQSMNIGSGLDRKGVLRPELKIELYNIDSGQVVPTIRPLTLKPRGLATNQVESTLNIAGASGVTDNVGFVVHLRLRHQDTNNDGTINAADNSSSCVMSKKFQYERDTVPPIDPQTVSFNITTPRGANCAPRQEVSGQVNIAYTSGMEKGVVLLCRNRSGGVEWSTANSTNGAPIVVTDGSDPGWLSRGVAGNSPQGQTNSPEAEAWEISSGVGLNPINTGADRFNPAVTESTGWVPCDELQLCEDSDPTVTLNGDVATTGLINMTLDYTGLDRDCRIDFDIVAVDTAGNTSAVTNATFRRMDETNNLNVNSTANFCPGLTNNTHANFGTDQSANLGYYLGLFGPSGTVRPGFITPTQFNVNALSFEQGFYTCGTCCSGANCTPWGEITYQWWTGAWSSTSWSGGCGTRDVRCYRYLDGAHDSSASDGGIVADALCTANVGAKPVTARACCNPSNVTRSNSNRSRDCNSVCSSHGESCTGGSTSLSCDAPYSWSGVGGCSFSRPGQVYHAGSYCNVTSWSASCSCRITCPVYSD